MDYTNQRMQVLDYMRENGSITSLECVQKLFIIDGRKIISELRRKGYNITDVWVEKLDSKGKIDKRYKRYTLKEN